MSGGACRGREETDGLLGVLLCCLDDLRAFACFLFLDIFTSLDYAVAFLYRSCWIL
jgi:hypothetical protein